MRRYKYLIIGGGVAGTSAAETIRKSDPSGSLAIVSDEPYPLYSRIMLSKPAFYSGVMSLEKTYLKKPEWYGENRIDFLGGKRVTALDAKVKTVTLDDGQTLEYEKLLLAIGATPRQLPLPGASDKKPIYYLRTLDDVKKIGAELKTVKQAVIIGGGFIGFEMCDVFRLLNIEVTDINITSYFWEPVLDKISAQMVEKSLTEHGVKILYNTEVKEILGQDKVESIRVVLNKATKQTADIPCQIIVAGVGVYCCLDWIKQAGIATNKAVLANEYLETNIPDIWTAGDCAEFYDVVLGEKVIMGNWANAQMQGRTAALNMLGQRTLFRMVSFYTTQGLGVSIGFVGDVSPGADRTVITRGSAEINSRAQLFVKDGELLGATLINRTGELGVISSLIEKDIKVGDKLKELGDPNFDLKKLLL